MNKTLAALSACFFLMATQAYAVNLACEVKAFELKLTGKSKEHFTKMCEKDAKTPKSKETCVSVFNKKVK